jgi:transcription antitermination factor NusG
MSQPDGDPPWYVVHARPHLEMMAAAVIESRLELNIWLPEVRQLRRGEHRLAPLFPGYFFVQAAAEGLPLSAINRMPGVVRVVAFGPQPTP